MNSRRRQALAATMVRMSILLSVVIGLLSMLGTPLAAAEPKHGGTLTVGLAADIAHFDVFHAIGYEAYWVLENIHSGLVRVDPQGNIIPDMATSWDVKDDGRTYVFHLHKGITFHDGTPADAAAIKWNIDYILDPANTADARLFFRPIAAVDALDDTTLQIQLQEPAADFLMVLAGYRLASLVASPTAVQHWGKEYKFHPVGAGPFKFVAWTPGQQVVLEKNAHYFKPGLPYLDRIVLKTMKDATTRLGAVRAGELDFATWVPLEMVRVLERVPGVHVVSGPMYNVWDLLLNAARPPFDDLRVRQAVAGYGLDRQELVTLGFFGYGQPSVSMLTPGMPGYHSLLERYPYDPKQAKALLQEAGYGPGHPLTFTLLAPTIEPAFTNVPTLFKAQLERLGVQMQLAMLDKVTWMDRVARQHDFQATMGNLTGVAIGAFAPFFETASPLNIAQHSDTRVDALFQQWRTTAEATVHAQATEQLQAYLADTLYLTGLANTPFYHGVRESVQGYTFVDKLHLHFEAAWLER